jgi:hypothetical protein
MDNLQGAADSQEARAGQECDPDSLVLIDGFYATPKAFNGRSVHSPRLELLTSRHL